MAFLRDHVIRISIILILRPLTIVDKVKNQIIFILLPFIATYQTLLSIENLLNIPTGLIAPFGVHATLGPHKVYRSIYG